MGRKYIPDRGDLVWLQFNPRLAHEQAGRRPALVLSPRAYNGRVGLALFCPITSQVKGYPFEVLLPAGLPVEGCVLADQIKSFDWRSRTATRIVTLPPEILDDTLARVLTLLDPSMAR